MGRQPYRSYLILIILDSVLIFLLYPIHHVHTHPIYFPSLKRFSFDKIYQLGDSIADTGNLIREKTPAGISAPYGRLPYGETFFRGPTGRASNGLLMIDFIALSCGLPLLTPYEAGPRANFINGVNFAVAGTTALPVEKLIERNIFPAGSNSSLYIQLDWMNSYFESACHKKINCLKKLNKNSLFFVGETGGNDYNFALLQGKSIEETKKLVPDIVGAIVFAVEKVIEFGGTRIVVPGNFAIGCFPVFLTLFQTNDPTAYDELHCVKNANDLAIHHNQQLQKSIQDLKEKHPNITIVYGDYYNAFLWVLRHATSMGFDANCIYKACCGSGGDYNYDMVKTCTAGMEVCSDPYKYISWDGSHLTQHAYELMSRWLIPSIFPELESHMLVISY